MSDVVTLSRTRPRARVEHTCMLCGRTIRPGERYGRQGNVFDGHAYSWIECDHCDVLSTVLWYDTDVWDEGIGPDEAQEWEPDTFWGLRLKALYCRRWTRRDGSLCPIPRLIRQQVFTPRGRPGWLTDEMLAHGYPYPMHSVSHPIIGVAYDPT